MPGVTDEQTIDESKQEMSECGGIGGIMALMPQLFGVCQNHTEATGTQYMATCH